MNVSTEQADRTLILLGQISEMTASRTPLSKILRVIVDAAQTLTNAHWAIFLEQMPNQPPEYYGSDKALLLGPPLLQALNQALATECTPLPLRLILHTPISASNSLHTLAVPIFQEKMLWGSLATFYETIPQANYDAILTLLGSHARIAMEKRRLDTIVSRRYAGTIQALASAIDARDPSTHRHSQAVTELAVALAEALELDEEVIDLIRYAAILHDIGKIGISELILSKPSPLSPSERSVVEAHPLVGASILAGIPHMQDLIPLIRHHHERYNGSGYPDGLHGDEIPLGAQILAIADTFDAITTERPYHQGLSIPEALIILEKEAGRLFHPELLGVFIRMIRRRLGGLSLTE